MTVMISEIIRTEQPDTGYTQRVRLRKCGSLTEHETHLGSLSDAITRNQSRTLCFFRNFLVKYLRYLHGSRASVATYQQLAQRAVCDAYQGLEKRRGEFDGVHASLQISNDRLKVTQCMCSPVIKKFHAQVCAHHSPTLSGPASQR